MTVASSAPKSIGASSATKDGAEGATSISTSSSSSAGAVAPLPKFGSARRASSRSMSAGEATAGRIW